jgi:hypothetical protein
MLDQINNLQPARPVHGQILKTTVKNPNEGLIYFATDPIEHVLPYP